MNEDVVNICPQCKTQFMKEEECYKMAQRYVTGIEKLFPNNIGYSHFYQS